MAGFITLKDGRAYAASNWAYDADVERIADALPENDDGHALSDWLKKQRVAVKGLGSVDLNVWFNANVFNVPLIGNLGATDSDRVIATVVKDWDQIK